MNFLRLLSFLGLLGISFTTPQSEVCACLIAARPGDAVKIEEESALIVWDAQNQTEHFIRQAKFDTKAADFGFLVPTPTRPQLSEVNAKIFDLLKKITYRKPEAEGAASMSREAPKSKPAVIVLETVTVAGLDAAILQASDAKALDAWLKAHGYSSGPTGAEWLKEYVAKNWIITAFKISKGKPEAQKAQTSAVRMTFKTDRPFYPYREPPTKASGNRRLQVYVVSTERVEGTIGKSGKTPAITSWAKPLSDNDRKLLFSELKLAPGSGPAKAWLTRLSDYSDPREGFGELYFARASEQSIWPDYK